LSSRFGIKQDQVIAINCRLARGVNNFISIIEPDVDDGYLYSRKIACLLSLFDFNVTLLAEG
jgi:hypothetical protein